MQKNIFIPEKTDLNSIISSMNKSELKKSEQINFDDDSFLFEGRIYNDLPEPIKSLFPFVEKRRNKDIALLTVLTIFSAIVKNYKSLHNKTWTGPQLYFYLLGNPGQGKSEAADLKHLGVTYHKYHRKKFERDMEEFNSLIEKLEKGDPMPPQPKRRFLYVPGDITKPALIKKIKENGGYGFIFLTEADTLSTAVYSQYGSFKDILKNGFDGHPYSVSRAKSETETTEIDSVNLSVLLTSTINQCFLLIPTSEDGLFSRFMFYIIPAASPFDNVFEKKDITFLERVKQKIACIFMVIGVHSEKESKKVFEFTKKQSDELYLFFADEKITFDENLHPNLLGSLHRMAVIVRKIMMILSYLRAWENNQKIPDKIICSDKDFRVAKSIIKTLLHHLKAVDFLYQENNLAQRKLTSIPSNSALNTDVKNADITKKIQAVNLINIGRSFREASIEIFGNDKHPGTIKKWFNRNKIRPFLFPETETLHKKDVKINVKKLLSEKKVSLYKNVYTKIASQDMAPLYELLTTSKYKDNITTLRNTKDETKRKRLKFGLLAFTPSGVFKERRLKNNLKSHSNFICLDIDSHDNSHISNFSQLKKELSKIVNVAFCAHSVSGIGYYLLIPIDDASKHEEYFDALVKSFEELGINIDKSCRDVSRLRIVSFDNNYYMADEAFVINQCLSEVNDINILANPKNNKNEKFFSLLQKIIAEKKDITTAYKDWFAIGCALANEFGDIGRQYYHQISQFYPRYNKKETDSQFSTCLKGRNREKGFTLKTIFLIAKNNSIEV